MSTTETSNSENETINEEQPDMSFTQSSMSNKIEITFINQSNDTNNSEVVIFQKNVAYDFEDTAIAWRVIKNCGQGWSHPFTFSSYLAIAAQDSYGNQSPTQNVYEGQKWELVTSNSGDTLVLSSDPASNDTQIELKNSLTQGSINAQTYRDGKLLSVKSQLAPNQKAVFEFPPYIYVGVVSQLEEGAVISNAILSDINTKFSLLGITKADLIMTGGGSGASATPFEFSLVPK